MEDRCSVRLLIFCLINLLPLSCSQLRNLLQLWHLYCVYFIFNLDSAQITYLLREKAHHSMCVISFHVQLLVCRLEHWPGISAIFSQRELNSCRFSREPWEVGHAPSLSPSSSQVFYWMSALFQQEGCSNSLQGEHQPLETDARQKVVSLSSPELVPAKCCILRIKNHHIFFFHISKRK